MFEIRKSIHGEVYRSLKSQHKLKTVDERSLGEQNKHIQLLKPINTLMVCE